MTKEQLFTLLGEAEDCYVRDARQEKKRHRWGRWGALAACAALVLIAGRLLLPHGGAQKDPSRPYNVLEFAGAYYEILSVEEDRDILAAYGLPDTIPEEAVGAELGRGRDSQGNWSKEIFHQYLPYLDVTTQLPNGDIRHQRAVYVAQREGEYHYALFCNYLRFGGNSHEEIGEIFAVYGIDEAEDIAAITFGGREITDRGEIERLYGIISAGQAMGNEDYQHLIYGGLSEEEQQALSVTLADDAIELSMTTTAGLVTGKMSYMPTIGFLSMKLNYYLLGEPLEE